MVSCITCKKQISGTVMTLIHEEFQRRFGESYDEMDWMERNHMLLDIWKEVEGKFWSYEGPVTKDELASKVPIADYVEIYGEKHGLKPVGGNGAGMPEQAD